jgi:hypothetical protein
MYGVDTRRKEFKTPEREFGCFFYSGWAILSKDWDG